MAVVYEDSQMAPQRASLLDTVVNHPVVSLVVILIFAVTLGYLISKIGGKTTTASDQAGTQPATVYVPTSNTFLDYTNTTGSYNVNQPPTPPEHPLFGTALIRPRFDNSQTTAWDTAQPKGIPIRKSATDNSITGYVPYGTSIQIIGQPLSGESNLPQSGSSGYVGPGSTIWLPVNGGVISSYDVTGIVGGDVGSSGTGVGVGGHLPKEFTLRKTQQYHLKDLQSWST